MIYQLEDAKMDNKIILGLVDSALAGDKRSAEMSVRKLASSIRNQDSSLHAELIRRISNSSLRSTTSNISAPVDADSRLSLIRMEKYVHLDKKPIYTPRVEKILKQVITERKHADALREQMISPAKSLIFDGPPGVGKTMSARWLANKLSLPLITLDLATVMSSFLGKTGSNLRSVLDYAASFPCILLMDEFDAIAKKRDDDRELGELKRLVTVLLQAIDEWPDSSILIAATNHGELLDPAIWRRFDLEVKFELPNEEMISRYIKDYWDDSSFLNDEINENFIGKSFSFIDREMRREKREKILSNIFNQSKAEKNNIKDYGIMTLADKKLEAKRLHEEGYSQRSISQLVGLSRQTVKKAIER